MLLFAAACSDLVDERYATWDEAAKAGTIERGLVPKFVPATASNIRSIHDLDDNGNRLTFELEPEAIASMIASIAPLSKLRGAMAALAYDKAGWSRQEPANHRPHLMSPGTHTGTLFN